MGDATKNTQVQAVVDWFGPIYFSTMDAEFAALGQTAAMGLTNSTKSPETAYLGKTIGTPEAEELVKQASPQTYITTDDPAFFIQHGTADRNIPITQSENFAKALEKVL
jgi:dipeptidyl aminopeptidase/acylaminoacyl peptidase